MRKLSYLFIVVFSMTMLTSCWEDTADYELNDDGFNVVGFANASENLAVIPDGNEYPFQIKIKAIGPTVMELTEDITVTFSAADGSTAIEGTHYRIDDASVTLTKANNYLGKVNITMLTAGIEPPLASAPVLLMVTDATGSASVTGTGKPVKVVFSYACFSNLAGTYDVSVLRDGGPIAPYNTNGMGMIDVITETGVGEYRTSQVGHWDWATTLGGAGRAGYTFYDVCGVLTVPTQDLIEYYSNVVHGDESPDGEVKADGTLVITYKITSSWESEYEATYTPQK
jgi:hypothetical protein